MERRKKRRLGHAFADAVTKGEPQRDQRTVRVYLPGMYESAGGNAPTRAESVARYGSSAGRSPSLSVSEVPTDISGVSYWCQSSTNLRSSERASGDAVSAGTVLRSRLVGLREPGSAARKRRGTKRCKQRPNASLA